jgi:DinB superfamily
MPPVTPYTKYLGDRDPIAALRETSARIGALTSGWSPADFERTYEPGKWSARLILAHLARIEIAFGMRVRMALTTPGYMVQPFDQDRRIERETATDGRAAVDVFLALDRLNVDLFATLSPADVATPVSHPEFGNVTVDWIIHTLAGHQVSHLQHIEQIARQAP